MFFFADAFGLWVLGGGGILLFVISALLLLQSYCTGLQDHACAQDKTKKPLLVSGQLLTSLITDGTFLKRKS